MSRLTLIALLLAAACGGKSTPPPTTPLPEDKPAEPVAKTDKPVETEEPPAAPPEPIEAAIEATPVTVKLVNGGKGKKAKLVYASKTGDKTPVELAFDFVQKADSPQEKVEVISPTIVLLTDAETKSADASNIDYVISLNGIDARDVPNSKLKAQDVKDQIGSLTGLTITGKVGTNGVAAGTTSVRIEKGDAAGKQVVDLVKTALPQWPALPAEAVGVGAKWTATSKQSLMGQLEVTQETSYELVARTGNTATIKGTIKVTGTDVEKAPVKVTEIKGTGTTEATLTDGALPTFKTSIDTSFKITDMTKNESGTIGVKVGTAITPKAVAAATPPKPDAKK